MSKICRLLVALVLALAPAALHAQQPVSVAGRVTDPAGAPVVGAQVFIASMGLGANTGADGTYRIMVPAARVSGQSVALTAQRAGFAAQSRTITLSAGATLTQDFQLAQDVLRLEELVVTGISGGAQARALVPFTVSRVDASQMPVPAANPLSQLQGKVPGANIASVSGRPGVAPQVLLRGPTSINASGRSQEPLYIVDGIVLGSSIADLNPADIESVEVVKGAAASTLYGSRAASGVISITTKRGKTEGVRFSARSEYGVSDIERDFGIARYHPFLLDETGTRFCAVDAYGTANTCTRTLDYRTEAARINNAPGDFAISTVSFPVDPGSVTSGAILRRAFVTGRYPGTTYNAVKQIVDPKPLAQNDFSMSGKAGSTNFYSSVGHTRQQGAIMGLKGYERLNGKLNIGQRIGDQVTVDITSSISRATLDGANQEEGGGAFFRLTRTPAIVDITQRDTLGRRYIRTNIFNGGTQNENPLYQLENIDRQDLRWRYLLGGQVKYTPASWVDANASLNLDRLNLSYIQFWNRGFRTTNSNAATNQGYIWNGSSNTQSLNGSAGLSIRPELISAVKTTFTLGTQYERQESDNRRIEGQFLRVPDVRDGRNATAQQTILSTYNDTRQIGLSAGTFINALDRYTLDLALRRDGSSRFGDENRWQTYGRASAGWLMAREDWFPSNLLSVFTLRGSIGTAGNTPPYVAQYETYSLGSGGVLSASTLGNPHLRPEVSTEREFSAEFELLDRYGLTVTYANSLTKNQILPVNTSVVTGFPRQWQNAGELRNRTWEAALTLPIVQGRDFSWMGRMNYTRNRAIVEKLYVPPFMIGTDLQGTGEIIRVAEGERFGTFYGRQFMTSCAQMPASFQSQCGTGQAFQRNNEGYIVWVGAGNNPGMGITDNLWNAVLPAAQAPYGVQASWGMPMLVREDNGSPKLMPLGHALPDYRVGMSHTVQYKKFTVYGLAEGAFGQSVWNQGRHWSYLDFLSHDVDQADKSVQDAKPIGYYYRAGPGPGGNDSGIGGFYDILGPNNRMVEDASFVKLRELSTSYRVGQVGGFGDWTISVIGRNLKTWTGYSGFDPEVGVGNTASQAGSGLINAIDAFSFPQTRSVSFVLSTNF
jgi:TonB-linked SusC/RagA family outer membrane protein